VWQAFVCSYNTSLFSGGELSPVCCGLFFFFFGLPLTTEPWHDQPPLNKGVCAASDPTHQLVHIIKVLLYIRTLGQR